MHQFFTTSLGAALLFFVSGPVAAQGPNCGDGVVTSVTPVDGGCSAFTPAQGNGPDNYELAEGASYMMTISGVTECDGDAITVFVQSSESGNFCFNAYGGGGEYSGVFTMPDPACNTMPVSYKCGENAGCNNPGSFRVQGPSTGCGGVHLRAAEFDGDCNLMGTDTDCDPVCPDPAVSTPLDGMCTSQLSISPPIQGGTSTATYAGAVPGGMAYFLYSAPGTPFPFMGCDIHLGMPAYIGAVIMLDGDGDAMVTVSNEDHPCGQELIVQAFVIDVTGILEVSNAVSITFGS